MGERGVVHDSWDVGLDTFSEFTYGFALVNELVSDVFYCAPAFHTLAQLDTRYKARRIEASSRIVQPTGLPAITDDDGHWLSFPSWTSSAVLTGGQPKQI